MASLNSNGNNTSSSSSTHARKKAKTLTETKNAGNENCCIAAARRDTMERPPRKDSAGATHQVNTNKMGTRVSLNISNATNLMVHQNRWLALGVAGAALCISLSFFSLFRCSSVAPTPP
ncbi:hypothetical protein DQ04_04131000, partial [Trypanosoma grayi]|uniref:hypothetical protein n=1 Tax=Trypanosoma grayi TaxID=71804 RepID=UPI0004F49E58